MSTGYHHVEHVMGMTVSIDVRDDVPHGERPGLDDLVAWLHHADATFSPYLQDSPISRLGRGEITLDDVSDDVSDEVCDVLLLCDRFREETHGVFDAFSIPAPNGTTLDPSGLVKGWSIERAARLLEEHGLRDFLLNAGGDLAARGGPSPGEPWTVGVRHPDDAESLAAVLDVRGPIAVATSATYERGAHIFDPRTGRPTTELASVTIVGPDLTTADVFATTVFVMGVDGLEWLLERPGYDGFVVTRDDRTFATPGFAAHRRGHDALR